MAMATRRAELLVEAVAGGDAFTPERLRLTKLLMFRLGQQQERVVALMSKAFSQGQVEAQAEIVRLIATLIHDIDPGPQNWGPMTGPRRRGLGALEGW